MQNISLEARCKLAMWKVLASINMDIAEVHLRSATGLAKQCGLRNLDRSPYLIGEPELEAAFELGLATFREQRADKSDEEWTSIFQKFATEAGRSCGSSHDVYQQRFSSEVDHAIQYQTNERKAELVAIAKYYDYASGDELEQASRWNQENGYCQHGIELGCCPAGCGSD